MTDREEVLLRSLLTVLTEIDLPDRIEDVVTDAINRACPRRDERTTSLCALPDAPGLVPGGR